MCTLPGDRDSNVFKFLSYCWSTTLVKSIYEQKKRHVDSFINCNSQHVHVLHMWLFKPSCWRIDAGSLKAILLILGSRGTHKQSLCTEKAFYSGFLTFHGTLFMIPLCTVLIYAGIALRKKNSSNTVSWWKFSTKDPFKQELYLLQFEER